MRPKCRLYQELSSVNMDIKHPQFILSLVSINWRPSIQHEQFSTKVYPVMKAKNYFDQQLWIYEAGQEIEPTYIPYTAKRAHHSNIVNPDDDIHPGEQSISDQMKPNRRIYCSINKISITNTWFQKFEDGTSGCS